VPILDATAFFNMLFGSDYFNHLIGRLELATAAAAGFGLSRAEMRILQRRRVSRLAQRLAAQLSGWVEAKDDAQRRAMQRAAASSVHFTDSPFHASGLRWLRLRASRPARWRRCPSAGPCCTPSATCTSTKPTSS
jgi:hypothetical protein